MGVPSLRCWTCSTRSRPVRTISCSASASSSSLISRETASQASRPSRRTSSRLPYSTFSRTGSRRWDSTYFLEITHSHNNTNHSVKIRTTGSIFQPCSNEAFHLFSNFGSRQATPRTHTLTRRNIYNRYVGSKGGARVVSSAGTFASPDKGVSPRVKAITVSSKLCATLSRV